MSTTTKKNNIKPGVQTSEFAVMLATVIGSWLANYLGQLEASDAGWVSLTAACVYAVARSIVKATAR